jgi:hypothetical protein
VALRAKAARKRRLLLETVRPVDQSALDLSVRQALREPPRPERRQADATALAAVPSAGDALGTQVRRRVVDHRLAAAPLADDGELEAGRL